MNRYSRSWRVFRCVAVAIILLDTVRRMNSETRPIDWWLLVIEVPVLGIIAAAVLCGTRSPPFRCRRFSSSPGLADHC